MKADYKGFRPLAGIMVLIHRFHPYERDKGTTSFRPLAGIMVLILAETPKSSRHTATVSVPLRGLWFLSVPFINGFMKPLKWYFAGRIIYFHHFLSFARK